MTYNSIYQDVLAATDVVHRKDVSKYLDCDFIALFQVCSGSLVMCKT